MSEQELKNRIIELEKRIKDLELDNDPDALTIAYMAGLEKGKYKVKAMEAELAAKNKPDMFWNHNDGEKCHKSIYELLMADACSGLLKVGAVFEVNRAVFQPSVVVTITAIADDSFDVTYTES